ncbi:MAG: M20/M25/M40 family metallo-hydrolase [Alphaproteobacteria bacterium]|nr:MAG: M20/M25/M40 family metallo-hydrolase [Alphaproteobacteria bacterium]
MTDSALEAVLAHADAGLDDALERLKALLRIPSISTDPAHAGDCRAAAEWLAADLAALGAEAEVCPTPGHPMVLASGAPAGDGPRLLFYGHYDVQPVDPLDLWDGDPFEPVMIDTPRGPAIRARGASDDKGQLMTFIEAARAWIAVTGALPCPVTVFLEGEEESGSPSLVPFLEAERARLAADLALICDTGLMGESPAIVTMLRGLLGEEVVIRGADRDLHSGMYGGLARNPIHVLARILADLHDADGRVTLPGFYDGVEELPAEILRQWDALGFDARAFLGEVGLAEPAGERGRRPLEMIWSRPTAEVNGIAGGYAGPGFKTVLPAEARAKVSFRLVGRQDPLAIREAFRAFVRERLPGDCRAEFADHGASPASVMRTDHPAFEAARLALGAEWGREAAFVGCGGSIPVAGYFQSILGTDSLLTGFARDDDNIHAPNEKYDLESFRRGIRSWIRILDAIARASR